MGLIGRCIVGFTCFMGCCFPACSNNIDAVWHSAPHTSLESEKVNNWLHHGLEKTTLVLGKLEQPTVPVYIHAIEYANEPVPWGEISRGNIDSITLHVNTKASLWALKEDWTLYHELAHLYHPLLAYRDMWLAEGLATYLQNGVMLRSGIISSEEFVQRISAGLARGERATRTFTGTLSSVSENMWRLKAYQRVYWSGVAFFIEAELKLQEEGVKHSLVGLIARYQMCCRKNASAGKKGSALHFLRQLDNLAGSKILEPLYHAYGIRRNFPDITKQQVHLASLYYLPLKK
ncbi:hypothetical protein [Pseudoalteromonas luteoviolacea]|uniref:Peptidase M61 catalytic domain-containing protein n=1 Tax=Pseudoalteromonas luteoviolacea (strain 2ta16) TaxID=1353533 RepID=V4HW67_PSEL2|nr:hypothetical protein [Pseudoalteromonas luteoviolacea]ESP94023.1 hypothetical protein PL2TA16_02547 [Pseudoalteromonas luteoviolacea 2ta16]KZN33489.1 hypothetical protein N483_02430 [Pseudoalteromonas luteoviolacea NCIMB 1944]